MTDLQQISNEESSALTLDDPARKHYRELDSLRGLAASVVMIYHWFHLWPPNAAPRWLDLLTKVTPLQLFIGGHSSVILFFILSGFVLSLPQVRGNKVDYVSYLTKRICRIYLPYLAALAIAIAACSQFHGLDAYDEWFKKTWFEPPTWGLVAQHALFVGNYDMSAYNTAFWSLVQEMRISIVFPVLCAITLRVRVAGALAIAAALLIPNMVFACHGSLASTSSLTLTYASFFMYGILIARYLVRSRSWVSSLPRWKYRSLFVLSLAFYIYGPIAAYHLHWRDTSSDVLEALGGAGIILYSVSNEKSGRILLRPAIRFLGRISYSLYLVHGTILFIFSYLCHDRLSPLVWLIPYLCITALVAAVMHRTVEVPSIQLGKYVVSMIGRKDVSRISASVEFSA